MNILEKNKQTKKKRKIVRKVFLVILLLLIVSIGVFAYKVQKNGGGLKGILATAIGHNQETVKNLPKIYCLLLGQSQNLTDTIMVAEYDPQAQQASILSIPRDTFIGDDKNTATAWDKINAVYQTGAENTLKEIRELLGFSKEQLKYYVRVDTEAFKVLVDTIGGVTFDVPIDMKYDDRKQNLHINLKAGVQVLDGDKAEQVVRFRHNNDGSTYSYEYGIEDMGRMKTQRNFLKGLAKQTLKLENLLKINDFIEIAKEYVETNVDFNVIKDYIPYIVEFNTDNLKTEHLPGESEYVNDIWIYGAYENATKELVDKLFINPEIPDVKIDTSSVDTTGIDKTAIKIEILNGSGNDKTLEKMKKRLQNAGYTDIVTAKTSEVEDTIIVNRGDIPKAINEELKLLVETNIVSKGQASNSDVTIIIGK